jgi:hypothetical protein
LTVAGAVRRDLAEIAQRDRALASSTLAMSALRLAREMDGGENSATSKSMCAKALLDTMDRLRELAPAVRQEDAIDQLAKKRQQRRAKAANS